MGEHANSYLLLFSNPFLVESLLSDFVPATWVQNLEFSSLEKVASSSGTDDLRSRHDDLVWRVRTRHGDSWIYIYLLLEFQRRDEHFMAVRVMTYEGLLYQDLIRKLKLLTGDPLPVVVPIVLYNGHARWKSPTNVAALVPQVPAGLEEFRPSVEYLLLDGAPSRPVSSTRCRARRPALPAGARRSRRPAGRSQAIAAELAGARAPRAAPGLRHLHSGDPAKTA